MRALFSILMAMALLWCGGLAWFIQNLPDTSVPPSVHTDAIIVLTGGTERVEHGLEMLGEGAAPVLFISGVGSHVTLPQMVAAHASLSVQQKIAARHAQIVLDYVANSTQTNAGQAAEFVAQQHLHSLRLVTASYHMPRSVLEFRAAIPGAAIVADPVFPEGFHRHAWWQHEATRRLVLSEYHKYFAALFLQTAKSASP